MKKICRLTDNLNDDEKDHNRKLFNEEAFKVKVRLERDFLFFGVYANKSHANGELTRCDKLETDEKEADDDRQKKGRDEYEEEQHQRRKRLDCHYYLIVKLKLTCKWATG